MQKIRKTKLIVQIVKTTKIISTPLAIYKGIDVQSIKRASSIVEYIDFIKGNEFMG